MRKLSRIGLAALVILLVWSVYVYAAIHYTANFDSDEAVWKLMADHILTGISTPLYFYGVNYLGSIEAYLAALLLKIVGNSIFVFRFGSLLFLLGFFVTNYLWLVRSFNSRIATIATLLLAIPGPYILTWLFRPIGTLSALLFFGSSFLLLQTFSPRTYFYKVLHYLCTGLIIGLGIWSHPMMLTFIVAGTLPYILGAPVWQQLTHALKKFRLPVVPLAISTIFISLIAITGTFFSSGCTTPLPSWWQTTTQIALVVTLLIVGSVSFLIIRAYLANTLFIALGTLIGISPLWLTHTIPSAAITPSCPLGIPQHLHVIATKIMPTVLATRPFSLMVTAPLFKVLVWLTIVLIFSIATLYFIYHQRQTLKSLSTLQPLLHQQIPYGIITILFCLPILLATLGSNTIDEYSSRYLLITWLAVTVLLGIFLEHLYKKRIIVALAISTLYIVLGTLNTLSSQDTWTTYDDHWGSQNIQKLEKYLQAQNIQYGFADYWTAYSLTALTNEKLIFSPFNGADRYPPYTTKALAAERIAFIVPTDAQFPQKSTADVIATLAHQSYDAGSFHPSLGEQLNKYTIIDTLQLNNWHVYSLERHY